VGKVVHAMKMDAVIKAGRSILALGRLLENTSLNSPTGQVIAKLASWASAAADTNGLGGAAFNRPSGQKLEW
jgi:hypothetical protein